MTKPIDIADAPWRRAKHRHWKREYYRARWGELSRLRRENAAMLGMLRSLLDESRWGELDELIDAQPITTTIQ
jgi:hypothetical protein